MKNMMEKRENKSKRKRINRPLEGEYSSLVTTLLKSDLSCKKDLYIDLHSEILGNYENISQLIGNIWEWCEGIWRINWNYFIAKYG